MGKIAEVEKIILDTEEKLEDLTGKEQRHEDRLFLMAGAYLNIKKLLFEEEGE